MCLKFEIWGQIDWKSCFWKIWVKFKGFWKTFHIILMHFIHKILRFEEFLHWNALFFKILIFPDFRSIELVARLIEIAIKNLVWICLAWSLLDWCWIDRMWFLIDQTYSLTNRKLVREFFKTWDSHVFFIISKVFKMAFLTLFDQSRFNINFCRFPSNFLQGFCLLALVRPFYLFFFGLISFFTHFREIFRPIGFWDFLFLGCFLSQLINGFCYWMM